MRYANCRDARIFHSVEDLPLGWPTIRKVEHRRIPPLLMAPTLSLSLSLSLGRVYRGAHGEIYERGERERELVGRRADSARRRNLRGAKPSVNRRNCGWKNIPAGRVYFTVNLCEPNMGRASPNSFIVCAPRSFLSSSPLNGSKNHFSRVGNKGWGSNKLESIILFRFRNVKLRIKYWGGVSKWIETKEIIVIARVFLFITLNFRINFHRIGGIVKDYGNLFYVM